MKGPFKIAIISSQVQQFAKARGLADVAGSQPLALREAVRQSGLAD